MTNQTRAWEARKLLRAARVGTLASSAAGQPFASLVTPAAAADLTMLLLLSELSEHTRHLRVEPRCSIMVVGAQESANPQTAPRVSITGLAEQIQDDRLRQRYLAIHPYATLYAGFADFSLWRVVPLDALYVGGFGRAGRLRGTDLLPDAAAVAAIAAAEGDILARGNAEHAKGLAAVAGSDGPWQIVAIDGDGCDIASPERSVRLHWSGPAQGPDDVRRELIALVRAGGAG